MVEEGLPERMFESAEEGDAQAVAAWLDGGGGVDARCAEHYGATLLIVAASGGHEAMVRMLLQRGASVNLQSPNGFTALMAAALRGHTTIVQALLDAKADASLRGISGSTALMWAEHQKHTAAAQLLRQHAKRQTAEAEAAVAHDAATAPKPSLSGRRVRIDGLKGRPELNGRCGVAGHFDAAKGRYKVAVEGEAEAVLLKPANLQEVL
jgi:ankyrin repeat protein